MKKFEGRNGVYRFKKKNSKFVFEMGEETNKTFKKKNK